MRIAVLSDIHANLEALEAVLLAASAAGVERVISLGDVVGDGADPVGCIYRLQEADAVPILGNHDQAVLDPAQIHPLNYAARQSLLDTREALDTETLEYLRRAGYRRVESGAAMVHAHPDRPESWEPLYTYPSLTSAAAETEWDLVFYGHTHHAAVYCYVQDRVLSMTSSIVAIGPHRYLINPGSVGQPRDGDWRAAFALWDVGRHVVELKRVEYAVEEAQGKMRAANRPLYEIERIALGE